MVSESAAGVGQGGGGVEKESSSNKEGVFCISTRSREEKKAAVSGECCKKKCS